MAIIDSYAYGAIVGQLAWQRLVVPMTGGIAGRGRRPGVAAAVQLCLSEFDRLAEGGPYLVGPAVSLADLMLAPGDLVSGRDAGSRGADGRKRQASAWWSCFSTRPSMKETEPKFG